MIIYYNHNLIENNKSNTMSETSYNIDTTYVTGIICNACKKELPKMTMKQHHDGLGCPCYIYKIKNGIRKYNELIKFYSKLHNRK